MFIMPSYSRITDVCVCVYVCNSVCLYWFVCMFWCTVVYSCLFAGAVLVVFELCVFCGVVVQHRIENPEGVSL